MIPSEVFVEEWQLVAFIFFAEKVCDAATDFGIWWLAQHGIKSQRNQLHSFHILKESRSLIYHFVHKKQGISILSMCSNNAEK